MQTTTTTEKTLTNINEIIEMSKKCSNEYHRKRIEETIKQHEEIQKYYPCSINVDFTIYEDNEKESIYAERMSIFLNHEYIKIEIRFDEYRKKYNIFAHFDRIFLNVDHYKRREIEKTVTAPKNIGVLTTKKINDWVSYYEKIYKFFDLSNYDLETVSKLLEIANYELKINPKAASAIDIYRLAKFLLLINPKDHYLLNF